METKATDLAALHPAFAAVNLSNDDYFHFEWMGSLYSVSTVGGLRGVQVLANRKRKKKIASIWFDLPRLDQEALRVLREILEGLGIPEVSAATRQETARQLNGAGFECVFSPKTRGQIARRLENDLVVDCSAQWGPEGVKDGLIMFSSLDHVVNGVPAREKPDIVEVLSSIEFYLGLDLEYERE